MSNLPVPSDYTVLREEILQIISAGKDRARAAVEREKVRTYWEIGRVLHGHLRHWNRRLMQRSVEAPQLQPRYGRIYTYRVMRSDASVRLDVGFGMHYTPMPKERQEIGVAEMVEVTKRESGDGYRF